MPQPRHEAHQNQRHTYKPDPHLNHRPHAPAVDHDAGQESKNSRRDQKTKKKTQDQLSPCEPEGADQRGIENGKAVVNDPDREEKVEEGGEDNPPTVEDPCWPASVHEGGIRNAKIETRKSRSKAR